MTYSPLLSALCVILSTCRAPLRYSSKVDIFALGCVLFELCALRRAYEGENMPAVVMKIVEGKRTDIGGSFSREISQVSFHVHINACIHERLIF